MTTYREAIREAIRVAMTDDARVFLMGEDVGHYGGCYAVTKGLLDEFGEQRIRDTPLSESGFVGAGIGASIAGMRPIVEIMTVNFSMLALDQIVNNAATLRHMSGGQIGVPLVIRMATGAGKQLAAQHSHSLENWYASIPGIKVLAPATVTDARYMLAEALKDPDPVIIFEHVMLYNQEQELEPRQDDYNAFKASVARAGTDVTIITYGAGLSKALQVADQVSDKGMSVEVIDLRCLRPLDSEAIFSSVKKTGKVVIVDEAWLTGSLASEISAQISEHCLWSLDAPIQRVCTQEVPIPYPAHLEKAAIPQVENILQAVNFVSGTSP